MHSLSRFAAAKISRCGSKSMFRRPLSLGNMTARSVFPAANGRGGRSGSSDGLGVHASFHLHAEVVVRSERNHAAQTASRQLHQRRGSLQPDAPLCQGRSASPHQHSWREHGPSEVSICGRPYARRLGSRTTRKSGRFSTAPFSATGRFTARARPAWNSALPPHSIPKNNDRCISLSGSDHFRKKGWADRLFLYLWDEPKPADFPQVVKKGLASLGGRLRNQESGDRAVHARA
jgi:hypothetical protein